MKVAFVLHSAKRDGAGKAAAELLAGLHECGVESYVLLPKAGPLADDLRGVAADQRVLPYRWWMDRGTPVWKKSARTAWNVAMALPIAAAIRRWQCDVVYSNTLAVAVGALAARLLSLPHVWHVHELWGGETGFEFDVGELRSLRLLGHLSQACIANSETVRGRLAAYVRPSRLHLVYQSVTVPELLEAGARPPSRCVGTSLVCLVVGSILPLKRHDDAVLAVAALRRAGVAAELWLLGDGPAEHVAALRSLIAEERMAEHVRFLGFQEDPFPVLRAADVVLSCSAVEAFGRATLEAMLVGKPVVAARAGGNLELIDDMVTGLLYEPRNAGELASRLRHLADNPAERERLGENAQRSTRERFSRAQFAQEILKVLQAAAADAGTRGAAAGQEARR